MGSYSSAEMQLVYSIARADWANHIRTLVGVGFYPSAEMQSVYSATAAAGPVILGHSFPVGSCPSAEMQSVYSTAPADWASHIRTLVSGGVLTLSKDAVGLFYSPNRLGQSYQDTCFRWSLTPLVYSTAPNDGPVILGHSFPVGFYPSVKMQSVYSTAPTDWALKRLLTTLNFLKSISIRYEYVHIITMNLNILLCILYNCA